MKQILAIAFFATLNLVAAAQSAHRISPTLSRNGYSFGVGEAGGITVNYERLFPIKEGLFLSAKVGLGYNRDLSVFYGKLMPKGFLTMPHHLTVNIGKGPGYFEVGVGAAQIYNYSPKSYFVHPIVGYRLQPFGGDLFMRLFTAIPLKGAPDRQVVVVPIGIAVGTNF